MTVTFTGTPLNLSGTQLKVGDTIPEFTVVQNDLSQLALTDTHGVRIFLSVPSIDTPICEKEVNTFNQRAGEVAGVTVYTISMDLPFAQARWCGLNAVKTVVTASDYKGHEFAKATGTYINELGLLTRAAFVVDANNKVVYVEYLSEVTDFPNYDAILEAAKNA